MTHGLDAALGVLAELVRAGTWYATAIEFNDGGPDGISLKERAISALQAAGRPAITPVLAMIDRQQLLIALRNRRWSMEKDGLHPERIKEVTDIIDMVEAWETPR